MTVTLNLYSHLRKTGVFFCLLAGCLLLGSQGRAQAQAEMRASLEPAAAKVGRPIAYIITIQNGNVDGRSLPAFDNLPPQLQFQGGPQVSQQIQAGPSGVVRNTRLQWQLTATSPGTFTVPPQTLLLDGQQVQTEALTVTVEDYTEAEKTAMAEAPKPLLQLQLGKKEFYQGELVPVYCSFILPRNYGVRRFGLIDIPKSDFAIARFPQQGEQSMDVIGDEGYYNFTFRSTLSALRSGTFKIGPASMNPELEVPVDDPRAGMNLPPGFARNFPRGFMMGMTEPRQIHVESPPVSVTVLPLPTEGRPANFSGAVGDFVLTAKATPAKLTVGDPIAVDLVIEGSGNFDALTEPVLSSADGWKSYPAKRYNLEGQITQNEVATLERKIGYTQVFMPEAVHKELPSFELSFFSPTKKQYVTLKTPPVPLEMTPAAPLPGQAGSGLAGEVGPPAAEPPPQAPAPQASLTDIVIRPPQTARWVQPAGLLLLGSRTFWAAQAVPVALLLLAGVLALLRRRRLARSTGRAGELRSAWKNLQGSLSASDAEFLRGGARFIHAVQGDTPVQDQDLRQLLNRYETGLFTAEGKLQPLPKDERHRMQRALGSLFSHALSRASVMLLLAGMLLLPGQGMAQTAAQETPDAVYQSAREQMEKGDYARAQYLGESLLKRNPPAVSPALFQLLGDARYRQKDEGRAALWYQRALLVGRGSPELKQNLEFLHKKLGFVTFQPETPLAAWSLYLTLDQWTLLAAGGGWVFLLAVAWRIWVGRRGAAAAVLFSVLGLVVALPSAVMAQVRPTVAERVEEISVVILPDIAARTGAAELAGSVMDLPPGSQVRVLEERGPWRYVELPLRLDTPGQVERLRGWVPAVAITPLWPWEQNLLR